MCQLHISLTRAAQIYLELHFCVELHTKKALLPRVATRQWNGPESNLRPLDHKSNALTTRLYTTEPPR